MAIKIYFSPVGNDEPGDRIVRKLKDLLNAADFDANIADRDFAAVKTHFGEKNSVTHVPPWFFKPIAGRIRQRGGRPFLTETSTLYKGQRSDAVVHLLHAHAHGFTPENTDMPVLMADGLYGDIETEVEINGVHDRKVAVAGLLAKVQALICVTHPTGHIGMCFGGALKNLGMGLSSRKGKLAQHSSVKPSIDSEKCTACFTCMDWCPEDAIEEAGDAVRILEEKCIGCGECLTTCRFDAVRFNWEMDKTRIQELSAEHALGVVKGKKTFFINYLINFTKDCDCFGTAKERIIDDIGILASADPVAIDEASMRLIEEKSGRALSDLTHAGLDPRVQTRHGEKIGLGSRKFELVRLE
jgi:uncharacterized Fe-S center protein